MSTVTALFDYLVLKPKKFGLSNGLHVELAVGTRIPGAEVHGWDAHGRVADRLVSAGILATVPAENGTAEEFAAAYGSAPVEENVVEDDEPAAVTFPKSVGFGNYKLSDGSTVKGKDAAVVAEAALNA